MGIILTKIIIFIITLAIGIYFVARSEPMVRMFGYNSLAERYLGPGGSYTFWKILGIVVIILGLLFVSGSLDFIFFAPPTIPDSESGMSELRP